MAVTISSLADGVTAWTALTNIFSTGNHSKAALVRNIRFVNADDAITANLTVAFVRTTGGTAGSARLITASPVSIPPHGLFVIEQEISLEYSGATPTISDALQVKAVQAGTNTAASLDYVISGVERDS